MIHLVSVITDAQSRITWRIAGLTGYSVCIAALLLAAQPAHAEKGRKSVPFTYVVMGDPQYPWWPYAPMPAECSQYTDRDSSLNPYTESDCNDSNDKKAKWDSADLACSWGWTRDAEECAAQIENQARVTAIQAIHTINWPDSGAPIARPDAVVINGDLTAYFHGWQFDEYEDFYIDGLLDIPVLPGLGNHDYENNLDDCAGNGCYNDAIDFARRYITGARARNFPAYWVDSYDPDSLAYSWSHGHYKFIQLHNHPEYEADSGDRSVEKSWTWLLNEIEEADEDGKYVVLNMHDFDEFEGVDGMVDMLNDSPVVMVFAAHKLYRLGYSGVVGSSGGSIINKFGDTIPVWHSGHSGSIGGSDGQTTVGTGFDYSHKMLVAEFGAQSVTVASIDTHDGTPSFVDPVLGTSDYATYDFSAPSDHSVTPPVLGFVAVGTPMEDVHTRAGDQNDAGAVNLTYFNDLGNLFAGQWTQGNFGISNVESDDEHGNALAVGDFNGDSFPDLAAAAHKEDFIGANNGGLISIVYGTDNGLTGDVRTLNQASLPGAREAENQLARSLASGDFDNDGFDDLVMGLPFDDINCDNNGDDSDGIDSGSLIVAYGSSTGLTTTGANQFDQRDFPDDCESDDRFGYTVVTGDFNADGYDDVAVSAIGEDLLNNSKDDAGAVFVFFGSSSGLTATIVPKLGQVQLPDEDEANDQFGYSLVTGDFDGDGYDDLGVGVPFEDVNCDNSGSGSDHDDDGDGDNAGKVVVFYGSADGPTPTGHQDIDTRDFTNNACESDDRFGWALAAGDFDDDGYDELAVSAVGEDLNGNADNDSGIVHVFSGGSGGLNLGDKLDIRQSNFCTGCDEAGDLMGFALAGGDANLDGYEDLAIAIPEEDLDGENNGGQVYLVMGSSSGLQPSAATRLAANTPDLVVSDGTDGQDKFGYSLAMSNVIRDVTPPVLSLPGNITEEATGPSGATVSWSATATDDFDGAVPVTCNPTSGSTFGLGTVTVTCSASDSRGNTASGSFTVTVQDTTAPTLNLPPDITEEATGPSGAVVTYVATATDIVDTSVTPVCTPTSGSTFALGATTVNCSATDDAGNTANGSFNVTVQDTTPPVVTVPADITVTATKPEGADVSWVIADAMDVVDGDITPACDPASGSTFAHGTQTVTCQATDLAGNTGSNSFTVTVVNAQPSADDQDLEVNEDNALIITLTGNDVDQYPNPTLTYSVVSGPGNGNLGGTEPNLTYTPDLHWFGSDSFTFKTSDGDLDSEIATVSITVKAVNDPPVIVIDRASASVQYSDTIGTVNITATDVDDDDLDLSSTWTRDTILQATDLPSDLPAPTGSCTPTDYDHSPVTGTACAWTLTGQMLEPGGPNTTADLDITFTVTDDGGATTPTIIESHSGATELLVSPENALITIDGSNPVAVQVADDGLPSGTFELKFTIRESVPDNATFTNQAGDISNAVSETDIKLQPVGPGGSFSPDSCTDVSNGASGYAEIITFTCSFSDVEVNTYSVDVSVNGGHYIAMNEDVLTVFDPSLGFTTGGGWFYWPGTTDKTNFGYTMKYNNKRTNLQGSLMLIRHIEGAPEDEDKWRIKSNSLHGLALGSETDFSWAVFDGKTTYKAPGMDNEGNHEFTVYVEDHGTPGAGADRIWLEVRDKLDDVVDDLSMGDPAVDNAETLNGGNIFVPHQGSGKQE